MKKQIEQVKEFQKAFDQLINYTPKLIDRDLANLRYKLMAEENDEYLDAIEDNDIVEIADALGDQLYVLLGTILSHGMQYIIEDVLTEIHRSNMSKLDADGKPIINGANGVIDNTRALGKVLKSANYSKPNIEQFLTK
jgi:predicted HAD superfamily Cof-like phosphohydrolase